MKMALTCYICTTSDFILTMEGQILLRKETVYSNEFINALVVLINFWSHTNSDTS